LNYATNFIVATDYRIKFSIAGASGQVDAILLERGFLVFTHVGRTRGVGGFIPRFGLEMQKHAGIAERIWLNAL
jgi:hypothetical protein